jgi:hypothetical protein
VEYFIVAFDHTNRTAKMALRAEALLNELQEPEKRGDENLVISMRLRRFLSFTYCINCEHCGQ